MSSSKFVRRIKSMVVVSTCSSFLFSGVLYHQNDETFFDNFLMPLSRFFLNDEKLQKLGIFLCKWNLVPRNNYKDPFSLVSFLYLMTD